MSKYLKILIFFSIVISCISILFSVFNAIKKDEFSSTKATYQGTIEKWENNTLTLKESNTIRTVYITEETQSFVDIYSDTIQKTPQRSNRIIIQNIDVQNLVGKKASILAVRSKKGIFIASEIHIYEVVRVRRQDSDKNIDTLFPPPRIPTIPKP